MCHGNSSTWVSRLGSYLYYSITVCMHSSQGSDDACKLTSRDSTAHTAGPVPFRLSPPTARRQRRPSGFCRLQLTPWEYGRTVSASAKRGLFSGVRVRNGTAILGNPPGHENSRQPRSEPFTSIRPSNTVVISASRALDAVWVAFQDECSACKARMAL
ncbi:hypothetical protein BC826DRAFT_519842 [Russula brevipes]|nr:hypothetical protein BC826DRAFT_519842 [Russula brevipes]